MVSKAGCLDEDKRCFGQGTVRLPERATVMVVGEVDTGKSTLVALLARWFLSTGRKAAIVDADIDRQT